MTFYNIYAIVVDQGTYNYRNKWINIPIFSYFPLKNSYFFPIFQEKNSYFPIFWTIPITWQPGLYSTRESNEN